MSTQQTYEKQLAEEDDRHAKARRELSVKAKREVLETAIRERLPNDKLAKVAMSFALSAFPRSHKGKGKK